MKKSILFWLIAIQVLFPLLGHATTFETSNCDNVPAVQRREFLTTCVQSGTGGSRVAGEIYVWKSAAWQRISGAGSGSTGAGGTNTQLQYNNSGNQGGIIGATSDGTNTTYSSGALRTTRPRIGTSFDDSAGNQIGTMPGDATLALGTGFKLSFDTTSQTANRTLTPQDANGKLAYISGSFANNDCPKASVSSGVTTFVTSSQGCAGSATVNAGLAGRLAAYPADGTTVDDTASADSVSQPTFCQDAGSSDTYACSLSPAPSAYTTGTHYRFKAATVNTGAATINFNTLGAKTIKKVHGGVTTDLADNDIRAGQWVEVVYDGTNMQMVSQVGNVVGGSVRIKEADGTPDIAAVSVLTVPSGLLTDDGSGAATLTLAGYWTKSADPATSNNAAAGYAVGDMWTNTTPTPHRTFIKTSESGGTANWTPVANNITGLTSNGVVFEFNYDANSGGGVYPRGIISACHDATAHSCHVGGQKAHGTKASPTAVVANDFLAAFVAEGYDGTSYVLAGYITWIVNGAVSTGSVPTTLALATSEGNAILINTVYNTYTKLGTALGDLNLYSASGFVGIGADAIGATDVLLSVKKNTGSTGMTTLANFSNTSNVNFMIDIANTGESPLRARIGPSTNTPLMFKTNNAERWGLGAAGTFYPATSLSTGMTDGFINLPGAAGTPSGTPAITTGYPTYYDATNDKVCVYRGAWRCTGALS